MALFRKCCCCWCCCFKKCREKQSKNTSVVDSMPIKEANIRVMAIYDFDKRYSDNMHFARGDRLVVLDDSDDNWWKARHTQTGEVGMVPSNFLRRLEPRPENHEAWYHVVRREATFLLSKSGPGSFLLRPYAKDDAHCTLSVCGQDPTGTALTYKHYKVFIDPDGLYRFCHMAANSDFFQLIDDHKEPVKCNCGTVLTTHCVDETCNIIRELQIPRERLKIDYSLGGGHFGEVWHGYLESLQVAVKMVKSDKAPTPQLAQSFMEEARKMCQIKHPNVVHLLGVCMDNGPMLLVMEYLSRGTLLQQLRDDAGNYITFSRICNMLSQVCNGMDYVGETLNLVHRDLRAANILVADNLTVKIADFGLARDSEYLPTTFQLPIRWTAPEAFSPDGNSIKADVWSFGVLTYEIVTFGWVPYAEMTKDEVKIAVADGYRLKNPHGRKIVGGSRLIECPDAVYKRMMECWNTDPQQRPTFAFLNAFFNDYTGMSDIEYLNAEEVF